MVSPNLSSNEELCVIFPEFKFNPCCTCIISVVCAVLCNIGPYYLDWQHFRCITWHRMLTCNVIIMCTVCTLLYSMFSLYQLMLPIPARVYFIDTKAVIWLPQCQGSNTVKYALINHTSHWNIWYNHNKTKHNTPVFILQDVLSRMSFVSSKSHMCLLFPVLWCAVLCAIIVLIPCHLCNRPYCHHFPECNM